MEELKIDSVSFNSCTYYRYSNDLLAKTLNDEGYENETYYILSNLLSDDNSLFIDVGANIGYHTIRVCGENRKIKCIAIEPHKEIYNLLQKNIVYNSLDVECLNYAVSNKYSNLSMERIDSTREIDMGELRITNKEDKKFEVECIELDDLIEDISLMNRKTTVLKINVCGNELDVLKSSIVCISNYRPFIVFTLDTINSSIKNLLNSLNYLPMKIHSLKKINYLFFPKEKRVDIDKKFNSYIQKIKNEEILYIPKDVYFKNTPIKKDILPTVLKQKRVKLLCNWTSSEDLCRTWNKMSKGGCEWNSIKITSSDVDIDFYVIINKPLPNSYYIKSKTIVFRMEPDTEENNYWNDWYTDKSEFFLFMDLSKFRNNSEWHLSCSFDTLKNAVYKTKNISTVISSQYSMDGHRKRVDFVKYIESKGFEIDVYGRDNLHCFKNYKGSLPYHCKDEGILPYKYSFAAENCSKENYFTEKIIDCILGECVCFYWGCPNIGEYIDRDCFVNLPLEDMEQSLQVVKKSIEENVWTKKIESIRKMKEKVINDLSFFPRLERLINLFDYKFYCNRRLLLEKMGIYNYTIIDEKIDCVDKSIIVNICDEKIEFIKDFVDVLATEIFNSINNKNSILYKIDNNNLIKVKYINDKNNYVKILI